MGDRRSQAVSRRPLGGRDPAAFPRAPLRPLVRHFKAHDADDRCPRGEKTVMGAGSCARSRLLAFTAPPLRRRRRLTSRTHTTCSSTVHRVSAHRSGVVTSPGCPPRCVAPTSTLYLVMDVRSRRIVGWKIADRESAELAAEFFTQVCRGRQIDPKGLVLHSAEEATSRTARSTRARLRG